MDRGIKMDEKLSKSDYFKLFTRKGQEQVVMDLRKQVVTDIKEKGSDNFIVDLASHSTVQSSLIAGQIGVR